MRRVCLLVTVALLALGCGPKRSPAIHRPSSALPAQEKDSRPTRDVYVLLLILDGARADTVYGAVDRGELPNLEEHVFGRGSKVEHAVTVFPSVTTSGHQAFLTGLFPGHSGITGLDWFDRASGRVTDYLTFDILGIREDLLNKVGTVHPDELFEAPANLIDDLHGIPRATVYEAFHMGIADRGPKFLLGAPTFNFIFHRHKALTQDAASRLLEIYSRPKDAIPRFVMATFLGHDVVQHHDGIDSEALREEMRFEDEKIGEIVARMKEAGIWEKTYIVVSSDHGQHRTGKYLSIPKLLRDSGLRPRGFYAARVNSFASQVAITSASIYLNKGDWRDDVSLEDLRAFPGAEGERVDVIESVLARPAIEFALVPESPDGVHVLASNGRHGLITRRSFQGTDYFSYATLGNGGDPLGYAGDPKVAGWVNDGRFHSGDEWGLATVDSQYPDAPLQLLQLFDGDRAGDLMVTAAPGWHFRPRNYLASHGGMGREDMLIPLVISGPDIARTTVPFARTTDVYPTLRRVFGMSVSTERMDGRPLDEILPFVPESDRVPPRFQPTATAENYFSALAALEAFVAPVNPLRSSGEYDAPLASAELFETLKQMEYESFSSGLDAEIERDAALRREMAEMADHLRSEVRRMGRKIRQEGRDVYNDGLFLERRMHKRDRERIFILTRSMDRLDARLARSARLRQLLELVRIADDVEELRELYAMALRKPRLPADATNVTR